MDAATQYVSDNAEDLVSEAAEFTELEEEIVSQFYPSRYVVATGATTDELQAPIDFLVERGILDDAPSLDAVISDVFPMAD
jgi:hypothetical protein